MSKFEFELSNINKVYVNSEVILNISIRSLFPLPGPLNVLNILNFFQRFYYFIINILIMLPLCEAE